METRDCVLRGRGRVPSSRALVALPFSPSGALPWLSGLGVACAKEGDSQSWLLSCRSPGGGLGAVSGSSYLYDLR